jgi:hypothetical protein
MNDFSDLLGQAKQVRKKRGKAITILSNTID